MYENTGDKTTVNYKTKRSFNLQPKTIICEAQAKKAELVSKIKWRTKERLFKRKRA